jgi:hypothetical protein
LFQTTCLLVRNRNSFRKWFNCSKQPTYWWKIRWFFMKVVKLFDATCSLVKNTKIFYKWSNCSRQPTC